HLYSLSLHDALPIWTDDCSHGRPNIAWARIAPVQQPSTWTTAYAPASCQDSALRTAWTSDTAGLKCAPLTGPKSAISVASTATVAPVFARSATAALPPASRSAMTPEPTTVAASRSDPIASADRRRSTLIALGRRAGESYRSSRDVPAA